MIALAVLGYEYEGGLGKDFYKQFRLAARPGGDLLQVQKYVIKEDYVDLVDLPEINKMTLRKKESMLFTACLYGSIKCLEKILTLFPEHNYYICEQLANASDYPHRLPDFKMLLSKYGSCSVCEGRFLTSAVIHENLSHIKTLRELGAKYDGHLAIAARGGRIKTMKYIFKDIKANSGSVLSKKRRKQVWVRTEDDPDYDNWYWIRQDSRW
jgi:hypothetical protein